MRRHFTFAFLLAWGILCATPYAGDAQSMRQQLNSLFVFSAGGDPLFLAGSAGAPATQVHGNHFIPAESEGNGLLIEFLNQAISRNVGTFPLSSTAASQTFSFVGGVPTPSSTSFGPIYAERGQTLGRGRLNAGLSVSRMRLSTLRGVPLRDIQFSFVHENSDFPNCNVVFGGDCSVYGVPQFEHDVIELHLDLNLDADLFAFYATFGLTDWLDVGFAVPIIDFSLRGFSTARVVPATGANIVHFFGGTPEAPIMEASKQAFSRATGVGDIAGRVKARIFQSEALHMALLGEVRAPTGSEEDFLGSGTASGRGLFIASALLGDFSPHINVGYAHRGGDVHRNTVEMVAGFDHRFAPWATFAADVLGAFQVGEETLRFPREVVIPLPYERRVRTTNIPDIGDNIVNGSFGFKFRTGGGITALANFLVPLNDGGLRARTIPTIGVEYGF